LSWSVDGVRLRSVLVSRLRYLGDIVMSTVVLQALRRGDPDLELGYLCEAQGAPLLQDHPSFTRLHVLVSRRRGSDVAARRSAKVETAAPDRGFWHNVGELRRQRYDLGVDLFFNPRSAWLMRLSGARFRIGGARGLRRRLFTHAATSPTSAEDAAFRLAAPGGLGEHLGRLMPLHHQPSGRDFRTWYLDEFPDGLAPVLHPVAASRTVLRALQDLGVEASRGYTLLVPGATWPAKAWSPESWGELSRALVDAGRGPVVMLSPPDGGAVYRDALTRAGLPPGGSLPPLSLRDALAVVSHSSLVVTVDGGLMHAAVALARPTIALLGPTDPDIWFPYEALGPFRALCTRPPCHPCDLHACDDFVCLPALTPVQVMAAVAELRIANREQP